MRYDKKSGEELRSTQEAARQAGISYITLRRWLASGDFQKWLDENGKRSLHSMELANGKRVWQFGNQNRADLAEYRDLPERRQRGAMGRPLVEVKQERNSRRALKRMQGRGYKVNPEERSRNMLFRRYVKALVELRNIGFFPKDARLHQVPRRHISESAVMDSVTEAYYASEHRRLAEELGRFFTGERPAYLTQN